MLGAEKSYQLGNLIMGERLAEAGHFLATVFDLGGNLRGLHGLADVGQGRSFWGSLASCPVAISAALVTEKSGSGLFRSFGVRCQERLGRGCDGDGK